MNFLNFRNSQLYKILLNASWASFEQFARILSAITVGVLLPRYLGVESFGIYSYALSFSAIIGIVGKGGLDAFIVRDLAKNPDNAATILGTAFRIRLILGIITFGAASVLVVVLNQGFNRYSFAVVIVSLVYFFQWLEITYFCFQAQVNIKPAIIVRIICIFAFSGLRVLAIYYKLDFVVFVILFAIENIASNVGVGVTYYRSKLFASSRKWTFSENLAREYIKASWSILLANFMVLVYLKIDQVLLQMLSTPIQLGFYAAAARISEIWFFIPVAISWSVFPMLVKSKEAAPQVFEKKVILLYSSMLFLALAVAIFVSIFRRFVVVFLLGPTFDASADILIIHIWSGIFVFLDSIRGKLLISFDKTKFYFLSTVLGAFSNIILNIILIPRYHALGAAIATLISYSVVTFFSAIIFNRFDVILPMIRACNPFVLINYGVGKFYARKA